MASPTHAKGLFWIVPGLLGCLIIICFILYDPRTIFVSWRDLPNLTFSTKADLEIANIAWPWRRASLRLLCSSTGSLHLLLRARMPGQREFLRRGDDDAVDLIVGGKDLKLHERMTLIEVGPVDTLPTTELSAAELSDLAASFGTTPASTVSVMTMQRGIYQAGVSDEASIRNFIKH